MKLVKIEDGKLEYDDFLFKSTAGDFLGTNTYSRYPDKFVLKSGWLERVFKYENYVLVIDKEPTVLEYGDEFALYVRNGSRRSGISEAFGSTSQPTVKWKLAKHGDFIQSYVSHDGITWVDFGGGQIKDNAEIQGFYVSGTKELVMTKYSLYRNHYVTVYDIEDNTTVTIEDEFGNVVVTRQASGDMAELFLPNPITGRIKLYDSNNVLIYDTGLIALQYGDSFMRLKYDIDLYYKRLVLQHETTKLDTLYEKVQIKNNSATDIYNNISVSVFNETTDTIVISLDDVNYSKDLIIPELRPSLTIDIYIKITKDRNKPNFGMRGFSLEID